MTVAVQFAARTDVGLVRSRNEDSGYAGPHLLAVADGMGGHAGGDVASSLVIARLAPLDGDSHGADDALELLAETIAAANRSLAASMADKAELQGMGTTLTALMRCGATGLALVHIGDSRAYLLREGVFTQITTDHSFVQSLLDTGRITAEEAAHHPQRSLVTRVLTGAPEDEPDLSMRQAHRGDRYLICSDGLSDYVATDTIEEVVSAGHNPQETCHRLVDLSLKSGAPDNITCVVGDIVDGASDIPHQPIVVGAATESRSSQTQPLVLSPAEKAAALRREVTGPNPTVEEEASEEERPSRHRGRLRAAAVTLIVVLALAGALLAGYNWSRQQVFVGESGGKVVLFQGLPQQLGPLTLNSVKETTDIDVADLPVFYRERLRETIGAGDETQAQTRIAELRVQAQQCQANRSRGFPCGSGQS